MLEALRIHRGEDGAKLVVRRRAVAKRPKPAQKLKLLLAEPGDINDGLSPRQHRKQEQQQHFVEGIDHLAALPRIRKIFKMIQKNNRFAETARTLHRDLPTPNQRPPINSVLYPIVTNFFTQSPCSEPASRLTQGEWKFNISIFPATDE